MGRHRRSAPAPAATDQAAGSAGRHRGGGVRRKKRAGLPVRTGLLGASAALAVGVVAVTTGVLPGGEDRYTVGAGSDLQAEMRSEVPSRLQAQGDATSDPTASPSTTPSRSAAPSKTPSKSASPKPSKTPSKSASPKPSKTAEKPKKTPRTPEKPRTSPSAAPSKETTRPPEAKKKPAPEPTREVTRTPQPTAPPSRTAAPATSAAAAAEADVFDLVNAERAKVGCSPLKASGALSDLARAHSKDMADRGFFDHTNPDGETPWDRAEKAGVSGLGGENIARGQADAEAVMASWTSSEGHRANILNCDFTTMGVGVHMGDGGPWWTQNFGY
ncbi:CAP domain-containing protein [Streptomyces peucetius]|uniref:CAP domain-containing protein n=1 Tax=Streptomyces peucetius TaxID=1950 RepID=A0ABY6ICC1_STRPE|nr:CAP domain-containing protein [Streptomyces peucetius]UYQ64647.1 CAP domain-containing protein [Streptomyces peucetius]